MRPVKVLAVVCQMNRGGLENRLMDILRHIDYERVQIDIFTCRQQKGLFDDEIVRLGGKIYYNPPLTIKNMHWYVSYFKKFLLEHPEYRIVHAHQNAWCSVFCKGAHLANVPVRIAHSRSAVTTFSLPNLAKNIIKLPTKKYATHCFAVSRPAGEWLFGKKKMAAGAVQIWPNAIDAGKFAYDPAVRESVRQELGLDAHRIIMHVGNFTPPKNHMFLLQIFKELAAADPSMRLVLAGGGTHTAEDAYIQAHELTDKVLFLGIRSDVERLLQAADVFVFPSLFEGLPGAVVEAQAAGVPCVIADTITDEVCLTDSIMQLSLADSPQKWADAVCGQLKMGHADTTAVLREKGFDIATMVEELTAFYETVQEA